MSDFTNRLIIALQSEANKNIAQQQADYMRNQFEFFGLKSALRRQLQQPFIKAKTLPPKSELPIIIKTLWSKPQRELHYVAQELAKKYIKQPDLSDIELYEYMVIHKSWWDTVDYISSNLIGNYFKTYPELRKTYISKWLASNNMWLHRSAILFQLKYKDQLDTELLTNIINQVLGSKEFFINKAIGWMLREYSKSHPEWVKSFVSRTKLSHLSQKEALRLIN